MAKKSAGLLLYRKKTKGVEVLLVHPGGPFWAKKEMAAWSIPKGELLEDEEGLTAAKREFQEELGINPPDTLYVAMQPVKQSSKIVYAWATEANCDVSKVESNKVSLEWPPKSGQEIEVPEVDKAGWFNLNKARIKLVKGQVGLIDQLAELLGIIEGKDSGSDTDGPAQISLF